MLEQYYDAMKENRPSACTLAITASNARFLPFGNSNSYSSVACRGGDAGGSIPP
jgi:hypothetical protein